MTSKAQLKALFKAVDGGDLNRLRSDFSKEATVEARDAESCTALHRAARNGQSEVCRYLIEELGFEVNETASRAKTPLYEATTQGHLNCAETLIQLGASIEKSKYNEWNPLHVASSKGYSRLVHLLLERLSDAHKSEVIEARNKEGSTALSLACRGGHAETVVELIRAGANVNTKNHNDRVPLLSASACGSLETVRALIETGKCSLAKDVVTDKSGATPLHEAATSENGRELITWFLSGLTNVSIYAAEWVRQPDQAGRLPVHIAAQNGHAENLRSLLNNPAGYATLDAKDASGATCLFSACVRGHALAAQTALHFGSDPFLKDSSGRTCLDVAMAWKRLEVLDVLNRKTFLLRDGTPIPCLGLGTYKLNESTHSAVLYALTSGRYRLLDMAEFYGNENEVGRAIVDSGINRARLFLISKIWNSNISSGNVEKALRDILSRLKTSYLDMVLIHWPCVGYDSAYGQLIRCREKGLIKHIGVSNFYQNHLEIIFSRYGEYPALNQMELSVYFYRPDLIRFCLQSGILVQCYRSLGHEGFVGKSVAAAQTAETTVSRIAKAHDRTRSQVLLRWCLQRNVLVIPKSTRPERIDENAGIFDFWLTAQDMADLDGLSLPDIEEQWLRTVFQPSIAKDVAL